MSHPVLPLWLVVLGVSQLFGQDPGAATSFERPVLTFDLTVRNPASEPRIVVKVGVKSHVLTGEFRCASASGPLLALAEYVIHYHVGQAETLIKADPPLQVAPGDTARLKVSLDPRATGACGGWAAETSVVVEFDNGKRLYSTPVTLTSRDVAAYKARTPDDAEVMQALKHRDPSVRSKAVMQLPSTTLDRQTLELVLGLKLEDPDDGVRAAAAEVIGNMEVHALAKKVADLLRDGLDENGYRYCKALERLKDPVAVDALAKALDDPKRKLYFFASDALSAIEHPSVSEKVRPLLQKRIAWAQESAPEEQRMQYLSIAKVLVNSRDQPSVPLLSDLITNKAYSELLSRNILYEILKGTKPGELIQDPFILKLRPAAEAAVTHPVWEARSRAVELLCRFPLSRSELKVLIERGLSDKENWVRISGATCAAEVGYREYAGRIQSLASATKDDHEKGYFCDALKSLDSPCPKG